MTPYELNKKEAEYLRKIVEELNVYVKEEYAIVTHNGAFELWYNDYDVKITTGCFYDIQARLKQILRELGLRELVSDEVDLYLTTHCVPLDGDIYDDL